MVMDGYGCFDVVTIGYKMLYMFIHVYTIKSKLNTEHSKMQKDAKGRKRIQKDDSSLLIYPPQP